MKEEVYLFDFDTKGRLVIKFNKKKKKQKGKTAKQLNQLQVKKKKKVYERYTTLRYACLLYLYIYEHYKKRNDLHIYKYI